jgi:phosphonate transport system permease protein
MKIQSAKYSSIRSPKKTFIAIILALAVFSWAFASIEFTLDRVIDGVPPLMDFLSKLFPPDVSVAPTLFESAVETIQMVLVGTLLGALLALPMSAMASSNISPRFLVMATRTYLMVVRTIPSLVWAIIFVIVVGLGAFSGVLALIFYTLGYLGKLYYEAIESIDMDTVEGVVAVGANNTQIFSHAILPQILPHIVNNFFLMIEYNIRHAAILGLVGAGGIGFYLFLYLQSFNFDKVAMALLVLLALVIGFDRLSLEVRKKLVR